jgi:hypothetical protein
LPDARPDIARGGEADARHIFKVLGKRGEPRWQFPHDVPKPATRDCHLDVSRGTSADIEMTDER